MTIKYHENFEQGSDAWLAARCGLLTASEMKLILTPMLKIASNEKERAHLYEILAQRVTKYVEPQYIGFDMLRGVEDEVDARILYEKNYGAVTEVGFVTNDGWGFTIGYSPDGLVGEDGLIEAKSKRQKLQMENIIECAYSETIPAEHLLQVQTGLLVTQRKWLDFISYSGGLWMTVTRILPDPEVQAAIIEAATQFEKRLGEKRLIYEAYLASGKRCIKTERKIIQEISV